MHKRGAKILLLDIETAPIIAYVWSLWQQDVGLNQIHSDWHILSWSAKWLDSNEIMYMDQRNEPKIDNDKRILKAMWKLLDEADIVVTQNGKSFDIKKLNARFLFHKFPPPSSFRQIDTKILAKKHFAFTSNKLEYMSSKFCLDSKMKSKKFPGFELWKECLSGNLEAWDEMEKYNKQDVLSLQELYLVLIPWDNSINLDVYHDDMENICTCGNNKWKKKGFALTNTGKFQRYKCTNKECGKEIRDGINHLSKEKKKSLKRKI